MKKLFLIVVLMLAACEPNFYREDGFVVRSINKAGNNVCKYCQNEFDCIYAECGLATVGDTLQIQICKK